jgi:hypothetical protein
MGLFNPIDNLVENLQAGGMVRLTFSDLTGRTFYASEFEDIKQGEVQVINTASFREGMYILTITNAGGKSARKVVIRH